LHIQCLDVVQKLACFTGLQGVGTSLAASTTDREGVRVHGSGMMGGDRDEVEMMDMDQIGSKMLEDHDEVGKMGEDHVGGRIQVDSRDPDKVQMTNENWIRRESDSDIFKLGTDFGDEDIEDSDGDHDLEKIADFILTLTD
jgi:hypothetical protein